MQHNVTYTEITFTYTEITLQNVINGVHFISVNVIRKTTHKEVITHSYTQWHYTALRYPITQYTMYNAAVFRIGF